MTPPSPYIGRMAPAPTGAMHLGNARTFLIAWLRCRSQGGRIFLRIEDLDHPKVKPEAQEQIYEDLRWLGLTWDEAPLADGCSQPHAAWVQSRRLAFYQRALEKLHAKGLLYPCICTRRDIERAQAAPHADEETRYPGFCRHRFADAEAARLASGREPAWRFRVDDKRETFFCDAFYGIHRSRVAEWSGDFVVARTWQQPAYQLAAVVDDAAMGITEVVRADDLLLSTHRQLLIYTALELHPPAFLHVPLVVGPDGRRLAKRHGDTRLSALRAAGVPASRIVGWLAMTCGLAQPGEECMPADLISRFALDRLPQSRPVISRDALPF